MSTKHFSTGSEKLDNFIGGMNQGECMLMFLSEIGQALPAMEAILRYGGEQQFPIVYFSTQDLYLPLLRDIKDLRYYKVNQSELKPNSVIRAINRFTLKNKSHAYIILDDLSTWLSRLSKERDVLRVFEFFHDLAQRKKSVVVTTVQRTVFKRDSLIELKEKATICLDLLQYQEHTYCQPLSLKGRYIAHDIVPFRLENLVSKTMEHQPGRADDISTEHRSSKDEKQVTALLSLFDKKYERIFSDAGEPMVIFDLEGDYREFNDRAAGLLGYSSEELKLIHPLLLVDPAERYKVLRFVVELRKKKRSSVNLSLIRKNRKSLPVEFRVSSLSESIYFGTLRDLTEQNNLVKLLREQQEDFQTLAETSGSSIFVLYDNKLIYANAETKRLLGYENTEHLREKSIKVILSPESLKKYQKVLRGGDTVTWNQSFGLQCLRKDGSAIECRASVSKIHFEGKQCVQLSLLDISQEKQLIERISSAEKRYRELVEYAIEPATILNGGLCVYANKAFLEMFGLSSPDAILNKEITLVVEESSRERLKEVIGKHTAGKSRQSCAGFNSIEIGGKQIKCEMVLMSVGETKSGEMLGFFRDITLMENLKGDVSQRIDELNILKTVIPSLVGSMDDAKLLHGVLSKLMEVTSWESGAVFTRGEQSDELQLVHQKNFPANLTEKLGTLSSQEGIGGFLAKTQLPHQFYIDRFPSYLPHRAIFKNAGLKSITFIPLVAREKMIGMILLVTKKNQGTVRYSEDLFTAIGNIAGSSLVNTLVYQKVKESEDRKNHLIETSPDILYITNTIGAFQQINPQIEILTGYSPKEFYKTKDLWLKLIHPDDKKIVLERITRLQEIDQAWTSEYRILPKGKALYRWVRDTINVFKADDGAVTIIFGTIVDITEQKQLIDTLSFESSLRGNIITSLPEGVIVFDRSLRCTSVNRAMVTIAATPESELKGKIASEIFPFYDEERMSSLLMRSLEGEIVHTGDISWQMVAEEKKGYIRGSFSPLRDHHGEIQGIVGLIADISQRKTFENEIRESEHILSNVIDTMGDILILTNLEGKVIQINRAFLNTLGYSRQETNGCDFPYPWLLEEEMGRFVLWIASLREHSWLHDFDMTLRAKDGHLIPMSLSTTLLRNPMGEPIAMLNIARNITDRKRLMKDLENRNMQIEMINRIITKANETLEFHEIFDTVAQEIKKIVPCDDINVGLLTGDRKAITIYATLGRKYLVEGNIIPLDQTLSQYAIQDQKPVIVPDFFSDTKYATLLSYKEGLRSQISLPISLKGKTFGTLNVGNKEPFTFTEEHASILLPVAQQIGAIIDRVLLFRQVSEDSTYIHNLLDSIDSVVYTVDTELRIQEFNKAWHEFMHEFGSKGIDEYHGKKLFDVLPIETLKNTYQNIVSQMLQGSVTIFSQEFIHQTKTGERIYHLTVNPMVIDRRITGLVFTHTDITALKKSEGELKKSNAQLLALHEISSVISSSLDLQKMLRAALPVLKKIINSSGVIVYLQEPDGNDLVLTYQVGFDSREFGTIFRLKQVNSATGEVVKTKHSMYINEKASLDERIIPENREILRRLHFEAMAVIPLVSKDRVFGALDLFYGKPHEFSDQEQQILTLVGNQLGAAIENAQLYDELRSQVDRLTVLYDLSQQLTSTLNIDEIFRSVYQQVKSVIPFQMFKIDLYDEKIKTTTPVLHVEKVDGEEVFINSVVQPTILIPGTTQEIVVTTKQTYQSGDRRIIFIPMLSKDVVLGIMSIQADLNTVYTDTHLKLLESIGNLTAIALVKGKLYEETVQKSLEIQRRNKELDDFTYVVSHDLKEPLISIEGFSRILQADYEDLIQVEGKEYLDSIVGATGRMKGLIDDLLLLSRVIRPSESFKTVSVHNLIDEIRTDMEFTIKQKGVVFNIPVELPPLYGNETQLKIVFRNLIGNAVKFNNKPNPVVEIGFQNAENNYYLFSIKDNGIGIEKEFHDKIFVIFQRLHRREEYEGTGAGLAIVKKIIESHKGNIWVESQTGEGSTFYFTVPKPFSQTT